jgi:hypothetical protein
MGFNSRECEFADIKIGFLGREWTALREISYDYEQEKELIYGQGNKPRSVQRGNVKTTGKLVLLKSEVDEMNDAAVAAGWKNLVHIPGRLINITVVFQKDDGDPIRTARLIAVEFSKFGDGMKQGDKFKEVELPFLYLDLQLS